MLMIILWSLVKQSPKHIHTTHMSKLHDFVFYRLALTKMSLKKYDNILLIIKKNPKISCFKINNKGKKNELSCSMINVSQGFNLMRSILPQQTVLRGMKCFPITALGDG